MFNAIPEPLRTIIAFAVVLGVVVFVHELGHYLAAIWRGVFVETFSIGFGKSIVSWTDRRGTVWKLGWLPLGGYVKLHGAERPEDASAETRASWRPGRTLNGKSVGSRAIILAAGPLANFVLAAVVFIGLGLALGEPWSTSTVADVKSGSPADQAGMRVGDTVSAIAGSDVKDFEDIRRIVSAHPDDQIPIVVHRDAGDVTLLATPAAVTEGGKIIGQLGIRADLSYRPVGPGRAIVAGVTETWATIVQTLDGVWQIISRQRGAGELGGVIGIAALSGKVAEQGIATLVNFIALLSVNLGLINLFPIPVLDGGQLLFCAAEAVRGRPLPPRAVEYGFRAGLALIVSLIVFSAVNDLSRLGVFQWVGSLIG